MRTTLRTALAFVSLLGIRVISLRHRPENEITLVHQSMRYLQPIRVHDMIAMKQNIEVDVSRSFLNSLDTAKTLLDRLGSVEELLRLEGCFDLRRQRMSHLANGIALTSHTPFRKGA